jgi:galactokinase
VAVAAVDQRVAEDERPLRRYPEHEIVVLDRGEDLDASRCGVARREHRPSDLRMPGHPARRVNLHTQPLDQSGAVAIVPRARQHDSRPSTLRQLVEEAGRCYRVDQDQPLTVVECIGRDLLRPSLVAALLGRPLGMRCRPVPQSRRELLHLSESRSMMEDDKTPRADTPRTFFAPGRVNLIGEHTDTTGGLVLPVAIGLGIELTGEASENVRLESEVFDGTVDIAADGAGENRGWGRYVAAVVAELAALGRPPVGFEGRLRSTLPAGAGLSSSAALEVATALALCAVADFVLEPLELAQACRRAEHRAVGVPSGILDQAASLLGRRDQALLLDTGTLEYRHVPLPPDLAVVIVDSGLRRQLEHSGYAARHRELQAGDARRLRHVSTENDRVREVVRGLEHTPVDLVALGRLFRAGHESLRDDFEVSTPELDLLVELAYDAGAVAARLTGGGFGGSIVALTAVDEAPLIAGSILSAYRARVDAPAAVHVTRAADGAREL